MAKDSLTVNIKITGLKETLRAFSAMPKNVSAELKDASQKIARDLATDIKRRARAEGRQAGLLAATVKTPRDRVPVVSAGGDTLLGRNRKPAYKLLFGSEFGATTLRQFKPRNVIGYWFYPGVRGMQGEMDEQWNAAATRVMAKWAGE